MSEQSGSGSGMDIGGGRRLLVAEDALAVELRGGAGWARIRVIPYEDIRALYRFETTNWKSAGLLLTLWLVVIVGLLIAAGLSGWAPTITLSATGGATLLILIIAMVQIRVYPARKLKIEAYSGVLVVPDSSPLFFANLASMVRVRAAAPPVAQSSESSSKSDAVIETFGDSGAP